MRRLCERPGCAAPAEVSYGIDNSTLTVWLDNSHVPEREHAGRLCRRHANALVVPRGWTVDDRRQPIPQLFRELNAPDEGSSGAVKKSRQPSRSTSKPSRPTRIEANTEHNEHEPTLFETAATQGEQSFISVDPDETQAIAWSPTIVRNSQTPDEGTVDESEEPVFGRLMGRAFRNKGM